jgi:hypothetical protein
MTENLDRLLELDKQARRRDTQEPRCTLLARFCHAMGWLSVLSAGLSFIPDSPTTPVGPFAWEVYPILSLLGLVVFGGLTLLLAAAAFLRIRFSSGRFVGGVQAVIGLGLTAAALGLFVLVNCL